MTRRWSVLALAAALLFVGAGPQRAAAAPAASGVEVDISGTWKLHTNDCFFGVCWYQVTINQSDDTLTGRSPNTGNLHGTIELQHFRFTVFGVSSEDDWGVNGYSGPNAAYGSGTFWDGTGGSGTFQMWKTGP